MSLIASLDVALRGDTGNLDKALDKSSKKVADFGKGGGAGGMGGGGMSSMGGSWGMLGSAATIGAAAVVAAAVAAGAAIAKMTADGMRDIGELSRSAQMLGITTSALAGLQHGAALAGVGAEEMNSALEKFQKHLAEASQGSAEANAAFNKLGLNAQELKELPLEEAVARVGDALKKTGSDADQLQITLQLFGKSAGPLKEVLKQGSEGMAEMQAEAQRLGLAVSGEQAAQVREASRTWAQFMEAIKGMGRMLAVVFAPVVKEIGDLVSKFTGDSAEGLSSNVAWWQEIIVTVFEAGKAYLELIGTISGIIPLFDLLSDAMGTNGMTWGEWRDFIMKAAWTVTWALKNWKQILELVFLEIGYRVVQFGNLFRKVFNAIAEAGKEVWEKLKKGDFKGIGEAVKDAFTEAFEDEGALEKKLREAVEEKKDALKQDLNDFIDKKLEVFKARQARMEKKDVAPGKGTGLDAVVARKPAAMEAGSKEAFSVLYGTQDRQQKALNVANDQLKQQKQMLKELIEIRRKKLGLRRAKL